MIAVLTVACSSGGNPSSSPRASVTSPAASTSTTAQLLPVEGFHMRPGVYSTGFQPRMLLDLQQPVWGNDEDAMQFLVLYTQGTDADKSHRCSLIFLSPPSVYDPTATDKLVPVPPDLVVWLQSNPDLGVESMASLTVGGVRGTALDVTTAPGTTYPDSCFGSSCRYLFPASGFPPYGFSAGDRFRLIVLRVGGTQVVVSPESSFAPHAGCDFSVFGPQQQDLLRTLRFIG